MGTTSRLTAAALLATGVAALAMTPAAAFADPGGNNGTVKISQVAIDSVPDNDPHVGCELHVQWYGFDLGAISHVSFALVSPTQGSITVDGPLTVDVGATSAHGGSHDIDGDVVYVMHPHAVPQPQQGFHEKVTVDTTWSHGSQRKSKVIWFQGCQEPTPSPTPAPTPSPTPSPTPAPSVTSTPAAAPTVVADGSLAVVPLAAVKVRHAPKPVRVPTKVESGLAHQPGDAQDGAPRVLLGAGAATVVAGLTLLGLGRRTTRRR